MLEAKDGAVELPPDSTGSRVRTLTVLDQLADGTLVLKHMQVFVPADKHGTPVAINSELARLDEIVDLLRRLIELQERGF